MRPHERSGQALSFKESAGSGIQTINTRPSKRFTNHIRAAICGAPLAAVVTPDTQHATPFMLELAPLPVAATADAAELPGPTADVTRPQIDEIPSWRCRSKSPSKRSRKRKRK